MPFHGGYQATYYNLNPGPTPAGCAYNEKLKQNVFLLTTTHTQETYIGVILGHLHIEAMIETVIVKWLECIGSVQLLSKAGVVCNMR